MNQHINLGSGGASGDFDYAGQVVWSHFRIFYILKQVNIYFSFAGECCNTILL